MSEDKDKNKEEAKEIEQLLKELRYTRQMQRKRLYEQAKREMKNGARCGKKSS